MRLLGVCISVGYVCLKALSLDGAKKYMLKTYVFLPASLPLYLCFLSLPLPLLPLPSSYTSSLPSFRGFFRDGSHKLTLILSVLVQHCGVHSSLFSQCLETVWKLGCRYHQRVYSLVQFCNTQEVVLELLIRTVSKEMKV